MESCRLSRPPVPVPPTSCEILPWRKKRELTSPRCREVQYTRTDAEDVGVAADAVSAPSPAAGFREEKQRAACRELNGDEMHRMTHMDKLSITASGSNLPTVF